MSEMTMKRCGVLFDLDGVLLDSEGLYTIFWEQIDKEYPTGIDQFASYIKGSHLARIMGYFDNEEVRRDILNKLNDYERNMLYEFFPGALEFVRHLREAGIPMAIVTSSDRKKMLSLYRQYPEFPTLFDQIITGDMVSKAKPDPDCFLLGARLLGVDISDCIVFEDSRNGLLAGRASGARVIGVATTLSTDIVEPLCDMTIGAVSELTVEGMLGCCKKK
jgi:HAD superfamily hydrolase (TIGR01509 family)